MNLGVFNGLVFNGNVTLSDTPTQFDSDIQTTPGEPDPRWGTSRSPDPDAFTSDVVISPGDPDPRWGTAE